MGSAIIPSFASKSFSIMLLGVPRLKRAVFGSLILLAACVILASCGNSARSSGPTTSGLKFRALVSQDVSSIASVPGMIIIDAQKDLRANRASISSGIAFLPGAMIISNDRKITVSINDTNNAVEVIDNTKESANGVTTLPGNTESLAISPDNSTAYAAMPNAAVPGGGTSGGVALVNLTNASTPPVLPIPGAHFVSQSGDGSKLLVFSDNTDLSRLGKDANVQTVTIVSPFNIVGGTKNATCNPVLPSPVVCQYVAGFDHPVAGFFSSDNTQAWILNCGPECGGTQASIQLLDLHDPAHPAAGPATPLPGGATVGLISGQTMYVAGNPPAGLNGCAGGPTTAAATCGRLTTFDLTTLPQANPIAPSEVIPDGYHNKIDISGDGQLFIGSHNCTNIVPANPGAEQRGCLAILNTTTNSLVIPPDNGDVTGLQSITNRTVFYVVEGGELRIYDTTTDKIFTVRSIDIFGNAIDVKLIDF
jgi:hypothetical protein